MTPHPSSPGVAGVIVPPLVVVLVGPVLFEFPHPDENAVVIRKTKNMQMIFFIFILSSIDINYSKSVHKIN